MKTAIALLCLVGFAAAMDLKFEDCGNGEVKKISSSACTSDPCVVKRGQTIPVEGDIVANQDSNAIKVSATIKLAGVEVPYPGIDSDGCHAIQCPIHKGKEGQIKSEIKTSKAFPPMETTLTLKANGDNGQLFCIKVKVVAED